MARQMINNDVKRVYRAVVIVTYPPEWSIYGMPVGEWTQTVFHGPYLHPGPAKAAVTLYRREVATRWRAQARRNSELPMPVIEYVIESSELAWVTVK